MLAYGKIAIAKWRVETTRCRRSGTRKTKPAASSYRRSSEANLRKGKFVVLRIVGRARANLFNRPGEALGRHRSRPEGRRRNRHLAPVTQLGRRQRWVAVTIQAVGRAIPLAAARSPSARIGCRVTAQIASPGSRKLNVRVIICPTPARDGHPATGDPPPRHPKGLCPWDIEAIALRSEPVPLVRFDRRQKLVCWTHAVASSVRPAV